MPSLELTDAQLDALGAKLDALDLTDDERIALNAVFAAAAAAPESEVEGYGYEFYNGPPSVGFITIFKPQKTDGGSDSRPVFKYDLKAQKEA